MWSYLGREGVMDPSVVRDDSSIAMGSMWEGKRDGYPGPTRRRKGSHIHLKAPICEELMLCD